MAGGISGPGFAGGVGAKRSAVLLSPRDGRPSKKQNVSDESSTDVNKSIGAMGDNTQPSSSNSVLDPVDINPFIQQPSPKETLIKWVNEKPDESVIRQQIADQIQIVNGKPTVQGTLI